MYILRLLYVNIGGTTAYFPISFFYVYEKTSSETELAFKQLLHYDL